MQLKYRTTGKKAKIFIYETYILENNFRNHSKSLEIYINVSKTPNSEKTFRLATVQRGHGYTDFFQGLFLTAIRKVPYMEISMNFIISDKIQFCASFFQTAFDNSF